MFNKKIDPLDRRYWGTYVGIDTQAVSKGGGFEEAKIAITIHEKGIDITQKMLRHPDGEPLVARYPREMLRRENDYDQYEIGLYSPLDDSFASYTLNFRDMHKWRKSRRKIVVCGGYMGTHSHTADVIRVDVDSQNSAVTSQFMQLYRNRNELPLVGSGPIVRGGTMLEDRVEKILQSGTERERSRLMWSLVDYLYDCSQEEIRKRVGYLQRGMADADETVRLEALKALSYDDAISTELVGPICEYLCSSNHQSLEEEFLIAGVEGLGMQLSWAYCMQAEMRVLERVFSTSDLGEVHDMIVAQGGPITPEEHYAIRYIVLRPDHARFSSVDHAQLLDALDGVAKYAEPGSELAALCARCQRSYPKIVL